MNHKIPKIVPVSPAETSGPEEFRITVAEACSIHCAHKKTHKQNTNLINKRHWAIAGNV